MISGNSVNGIDDYGGSNLIVGNTIGTNLTGTAGLGNTFNGVIVEFPATGDTIGGTSAGAGNLISGNALAGIALSADHNVVQGNRIGTNTTGTAAIANSFGISINNGGSANLIGGTTAGARNVISGNSGGGIFIATGSLNIVEGNYIGTDAAGTAAIPNDVGGLVLAPAALQNTIGGTTPGAGNVIAGNSGDGIEDGGEYNLIAGNKIGTNAAGTAALGNTQDGVNILAGALTAIIGGTSPGAGNLISGNGLAGIAISSVDNVVQGNRIGTNATGTAAIANSGNGITIGSGGSSNLIGGTTAGAGNIISGNRAAGIYISQGNLNIVEGNSIGTDAAGTAAIANVLGIEVNGSGNTIGGTATGAGNVISGNTGDGLDLTGSGTTGNLVAGNLIGTNAAGTAALANGNDGVKIDGGASGNTIGGGANEISGNAAAGVELSGAGVTGNVVEGDFIGTDATGTHLVGNANGVVIDSGASDNTIGGTTAAARDVIDSSSNFGIELEDSATSDNVVEGNYIGLKPSGSVGGYNPYGILVANATLTVIGGTTPSARNIISANGGGVWLHGGDTTLLEGNYIGTDPTGMIAEGNAYFGVDAYYGAGGSMATIGGLTPTPGTGAGNVISGNGSYNLVIFQAKLQAVEGNIIGLNATGTAALGVATEGIYVYDTTNAFVIGGTAPGARNIISGNLGAGIELDGASSLNPGPVENVSIEGNNIGTDITGALALGNGAGVQIVDSPGNTVGGTAAGAGNVISANSAGGVLISGATATGNSILGNLIGTDSTGTIAVPNATGVLIEDHASANTIGGTVAGAGNVISGNTGDGVWISQGLLDFVQGNWIGTDSTGTIALANRKYGVYVEASVPTPTGGHTTSSGGHTTSSSGTTGSTVGTAGTGDPPSTGQNEIGGATAGAGNVISGNGAAGIYLSAGVLDVVAGNVIGTNAAGTAALPNAGDGILTQGGTGNTIGGTTSGRGTSSRAIRITASISGETPRTLWKGTSSAPTSPARRHSTPTARRWATAATAYSSTARTTIRSAGRQPVPGTSSPATSIPASGSRTARSGNVVAGNFIGTNATGTTASDANGRTLGNGSGFVTIFENGSGGVTVFDAIDNTIGGTAAGAGNVISGNVGTGVMVEGNGATGNLVQGNFIGTDVTGTVALANGTGVELYLGAANNTIGGLTATAGTGAGNVISGNDSAGVVISYSTTTGNLVLGNLIGTNAAGTAHSATTTACRSRRRPATRSAARRPARATSSRETPIRVSRSS